MNLKKLIINQKILNHQPDYEFYYSFGTAKPIGI